MYYHYSNIDPNTCYVDLNFGGDSTEFWTPYGIIGINVKHVNPETNTDVYCEFDSWNRYYYQLNSINQPKGILCYDKETIQDQYIDILKNNPNYIVLSNPHSNNVSCTNNNCIMYISQDLNIWEGRTKNIHCSNGICTVVWFVVYTTYVNCDICRYNHITKSVGEYSCQNATLHGSNTKSLHLKINDGATYGAKTMTIYGPNGNNTSLRIFSDNAWHSLKYSIIYAGYTSKIELFGSGRNRFKGVKLYAYHSKSIWIECNGSNRPCEDMKIFIHDDSFDSMHPYPTNRLFMECKNSHDCINAQLFVSYNISDTWICLFIYNNSNWYCNDHEISWNTPKPTPSPTFMPTKATNYPSVPPTILTTKPTTVPTLSPTNTPTTSPTKTSSNIIYINTPSIPWIIAASIAMTCCLLLLLGFGMYIYLHRKSNKDVNDATIINVTPLQASKDPVSSFQNSSNNINNIVFPIKHINDIPLPPSTSIVNHNMPDISKSAEMLYDPHLMSPKTKGRTDIRYGERSIISPIGVRNLSAPGRGTKYEGIIPMKQNGGKEESKDDNVLKFNDSDNEIEIIMDDNSQVL